MAYVGGEAPVICDNVMINASACVLGNIYVGDNAIIGCNAVVMNVVPDIALLQELSARIVKHNVLHLKNKV